ncbi:MAG: DUF3634 family protein [Myxococcaceae bacterium]
MALYLLIGLGALALYLVVQRQRELFCISIRHGEVLVMRGRVPPTLLGDFRDALSSPKVRSGTLRAVREENGARLLVSGPIDEYREQRLRNIFRLYPLSNLRAAPALERPSVGQVMGLAWLAWMLTDRRP